MSTHNPESVAGPVAASKRVRQALVMAFGCYVFWGLVVGYFKLLSHVPAIEIIAYRSIWSFVMVAVVLAFRRELRSALTIIADRAVLWRLVASALLLYLNWGLFVYAVIAARVLDSSFAYFINPILSVLLGLLLLGERLSKAQWVGVGLVMLAILAQGALLGRFPWLSLAMAATFAAYGLVKKQTPVPAAQGMLVETAFSLLIAVPYVAWAGAQGDSHAFTDPTTFGLLALAGPITVVPLIFYATAAQRLPLVTIGLMQYIVPTLHFLMAIVAFGEPLSLAKLATFVVAWIGLAVVTVDALTRRR